MALVLLSLSILFNLTAVMAKSCKVSRAAGPVGSFLFFSSLFVLASIHHH